MTTCAEAASIEHEELMTRNEANAASGEIQQKQDRPTITTAFSNYEPAFDAVAMVRRIMDSVPEKYLRGLGEVVLTNTGALPRHRRRSVSKSRGRKVRLKQARGMYHPASQKSGAWIEIFVGNTLNCWGSGWLQRTNWFRETELSQVLFHEIGHHIHFTIRPEHREKEDLADVWKVRLQKKYIRQRYGCLSWIRPLIRVSQLGRLVGFLNAKVSARAVANGQISRSEHEESLRAREHDDV